MACDGVTIDDYQEGDLEEILAIETDSFPTPWTPGLFRSEMANPISRMVVGRSMDLGRVVGYAVFWRVVDEIHLHNIAVRRDLRRGGIASLLLAEVARKGLPEGARWVTLEVRRSNVAAQRLYERFGFSIGGVRRGYYTDTGEDALIMSADLEGVLARGPSDFERAGQAMTRSHEQPSIMEGQVIGNLPMAPGHFLLSLRLPPTMEKPKPGQFVMIRDPEREEPLLPRPLSVCGFRRRDDHAVLELLYRIAGRATAQFSRLAPGAPLAVLGPLGRGFTLKPEARKVILLAGGIGVAPLIYLLNALCRGEAPPHQEVVAYVGARNGDLLAGLDRLQGRCELKIATDDGTRGHHGLVTDLLGADLGRCNALETMIYACGPTPMIRSLAPIVAGTALACEVSLEERMACGMGACLGCAVAVRDAEGKRVYRRVCHDGPVFDLREVMLNCRPGQEDGGDGIS